MTDEQMMKTLDLTPEELAELKAFDKAIDRGADPMPLSADQKKVEKQMRQADRAPTAYKFTKRERKPNEDKRFLINLLNSALINSDDEGFGELPQIEITNAEREINFVFGGKKYKIVLSAPRS